MTTTAAKNRQHHLEEATTRWAKTGRSTYRTEAGWTVTRHNNGWIVIDPSGERRTPARQVEPSAFEAKHQAERLGA